MTLGGSTIVSSTDSLITNVRKVDPNKQVLDDLVNKLPLINPTIPDKVSMAILENAGVRLEENDTRLVRLMSLAGQKFISDLLVDAKTHHKLAAGQSIGLLGSSTSNTQSQPASGSSQEQSHISSASPALTSALQSPMKSAGNSAASSGQPASKDKKIQPGITSCTLTTDDVIAALKDRGIHVPNIPYYQ